MNKWEKEVQQSLLDSEEAAIKELEKQYAKALKDVNERVKGFQADIDLLDQALSQDGLDDATRALLQSQKRSKIYQQNYQKALQGQVSGILDKMHGDNYATIDKYLNGCYETGFIGTMYDIAGQGVPLVVPINQAAAVKAVLTDSKVSNGLYAALGVNVKKLKKSITQEISRGIASSLPYSDIARNISSVSKAPLSRAKTIARTEGHRIQQTSSRDAQEAAKKKGADVLKQWDAALDARTRDSHARVDGEIRELDEKFSNGLMFPGDPSGRAAEVVNCRCTSNTRARWALDDEELQVLKERAEYFGLDKTSNFEDYKQKYLKAAEKVVENPTESATMKAAKPLQYKQFDTGEAANDFFYYDDEKRGLLARKNSQHGKWQSSLTQDEKDCISDYTGGGYYDLNNYLRKVGDWQSIDAEKEEFIARNLDSAISRYKLKDNIRVQRGVMEDALDDLIAQYGDDSSKLIGKIYRDSGYMSTTVLQGNGVATAKPVIFEIEVPVGTGRGAYVNQLAGQYQDAEYEFLLPRNSKFEITGIEENEEPIPPQTIIKMRLIADE